MVNYWPEKIYCEMIKSFLVTRSATYSRKRRPRRGEESCAESQNGKAAFVALFCFVGHSYFSYLELCFRSDYPTANRLSRIECCRLSNESKNSRGRRLSLYRRPPQRIECHISVVAKSPSRVPSSSSPRPCDTLRSDRDKSSH